MPTTPTAYCPTCRRHRPIVDQHDEGNMTVAGETIYMVTDLDCGHETSTKPRILCPAPGAPYVDPRNGLHVVASTRPRDLVAAAPITDPWA